jgi:hypothetical protein
METRSAVLEREVPNDTVAVMEDDVFAAPIDYQSTDVVNVHC